MDARDTKKSQFSYSLVRRQYQKYKFMEEVEEVVISHVIAVARNIVIGNPTEKVIYLYYCPFGERFRTWIYTSEEFFNSSYDEYPIIQ
jgi:hypothetical protein